VTIEELREIMLERRLTQSDVAKTVGTGQQAVGQWFTRKEIPLKWHRLLKDRLLNDAKPMDNIDMERFKNLAEENLPTETLHVKKIANINVSAASGYSIDAIDEYIDTDTLQISQYSLPNHYNIQHLRAIKVDGKSMLPTLIPDEYVIIDVSQKKYVGDGLYVVNYGGNLIVKRLQFIPTVIHHPKIKKRLFNFILKKEYF
jgi:transcriptional regulator with XRE-family HTH domain